MKLYTLPKFICSEKGVKNILSHKNNYIFYRESNTDLLYREIHTLSHAIVYMVDGICELEDTDGNEYKIENDEILFASRESLFSSNFKKTSSSIKAYNFFFNSDIVFKFLEERKTYNHSNSLSKIDILSKFVSSKNIKLFIHSLDKFDFNLPNNEKLLELKLLELLYLLEENQVNNIVETMILAESFKGKKNLKLFMYKHYNKNFSIIDLAQLSGRSLSTFNRDFKKIFNTTPKKWIIKKKMKKAKKMLINGLSVTDCAFELGYNNISNFIKVYKYIYNITPKQMQLNIL